MISTSPGGGVRSPSLRTATALRLSKWTWTKSWGSCLRRRGRMWGGKGEPQWM
ncbi:hypothetical protein T484DRAFT_1952024 [Baffinella frigidus]|nr:hypothetical protein T484DRAFT_1952024 [Cryptophyta sp. CCMP2293]